MHGRIGPIALFACLAMAACHRPQGVVSDKTTMTAAPVATAARPLYVGRWSATAAGCGGQAWVFTDKTLTAPSGMNCDIIGADRTLAGYSANSLCGVGAKTAPGRFMMTFTGKAPDDSLSLTDGPFHDAVTLGRCPAAAA